jgi:anti-sigma regulatory factor (Ser/Thr protein kinase)/GNAT superfamily N-acetyltransferase
MTASVHTELVLPNDTSFLRLARLFVRELTGMAGLEADEAEALVLAADEACTNTIEHAFEEGESGAFKLVGELEEGAFTLAIHDRGLPFDASLAPAYQPPEGGDAGQVSTRGMGLYLIHRAADEVQWINHGQAGKELRLLKRRPQADVTTQLPAAELAPFGEDVPPAPEQTYTARRPRPEEAIQISRCIYRAYGYTYSNEDLYYPERIVRLNETGELISIVGVSESGEVVGYCALERPGLGCVAELGQAVVEPAHRGRNILGQMSKHLLEQASQVGLRGVYGQGVTNHVFSQKPIEGLGARPCGMTLGLVPRYRIYKGMQSEPLKQRNSTTLHFMFLGAPPTAIVHAPPHHQEIMQQIYNHLKAPVEFGESRLAKGAGKVEVHYNRGYISGKIRVLRVGADSAAEVRQAWHDLCQIAGAEVVYLELPLAQADTPSLCQAAEEIGFFFSGVGPCFAPDGDTLRLQYLNIELDTSQLQILSPFGQELLAYIAKERQRIGKTA